MEEYLLMHKNITYWIKIIFLLVYLQSCKSTTTLMKQEATLADKMGSKQTEYLYNRIKEIAKVGYAFGHQDATAYGMGWKNDIGLLQKIATDKNKPYALTEADLNEMPITNRWTEVLDRNIAKWGISWALFWRNAWTDQGIRFYFV